jgi:hypothetical protein
MTSHYYFSNYQNNICEHEYTFQVNTEILAKIRILIFLTRVRDQWRGDHYRVIGKRVAKHLQERI